MTGAVGFGLASWMFFLSLTRGRAPRTQPLPEQWALIGSAVAVLGDRVSLLTPNLAGVPVKPSHAIPHMHTLHPQISPLCDKHPVTIVTATGYVCELHPELQLPLDAGHSAVQEEPPLPRSGKTHHSTSCTKEVRPPDRMPSIQRQTFGAIDLPGTGASA